MKDIAVVAWFLFVGTAGLAQSGSCRTTQFVVTVRGDESFSADLLPSLNLTLRPLKDKGGWAVIVFPQSDENQDWTYPVNMPLRAGESQYLGTGYGSTVQERLQHEHSILFLLSAFDFARYSRMADQALQSQDDRAAGRYLAAIAKLKTGLIEITPLESQTSNGGKQVDSARLQFHVTVPLSFATDPMRHWSDVACR